MSETTLIDASSKEKTAVTISSVEANNVNALPALNAHRARQPRVSRLWSQLTKRIPRIVGPQRTNKPHGSTVLWTVFGFIMLLSIGCIAVNHPRHPVLITGGIIAFFIFVSLLTVAVLDLRPQSHDDRTYRRNLGNTMLTIYLTIPFMTLLYAFLWYPNMNQEVLGFSQDTVNEVQFPSIALLQNINWTSQATLRPNSMKCFLGWLKDDAANCDALPPAQLVPGQSCNCKSGWTDEVIEGFDWQNSTYRYVSWQPTPAVVDRVPTYLLTLQAFFTYNASQSLHDSNATQSPSLWLAVYDPALTLTDALTMGYTRMVLISANGDNAINLGLTYRQIQNHAPAYDYDLSLSTNQNLNLVCDTSPDRYIRPCHVTLFVQIPTLNRKVVLQEMRMTATDVAASAGAFFSFVQLLSWITSGQAMQT